MYLLKKIIIRFCNAIKKISNRNSFISDIKTKFDNNLVKFLLFSYDRNLEETDLVLGSKVEALRSKIVSNSKFNKIKTFGSPHSSAKLYDSFGSVRPGDFKESSIVGVANTGTNVFGGIQLKKIVETFGSGRVLELGTNTGLSGCYFLSTPKTTELVTVEGSEELCKVATSNLKVISQNFVVINNLFDKAISELMINNIKFHYSFVDGQHEKKATILYKDLLLPLMEPGGIMIFDDIYWSEGMHEAWQEICLDNKFDITLDLGWRGICRVRSTSEKLNINKISFDITKYIGKPPIQRPGW